MLSRVGVGCFEWHHDHVEARAKGLDVAAHHAQAVAAVGRVFEAGNGLLPGAQKLGDLFLRQPAGLTQCSELQGDIPGLIGRLEASAEIGVLKFAPQIAIEVCLLGLY